MALRFNFIVLLSYLLEKAGSGSGAGVRVSTRMFERGRFQPLSPLT